MWVFRFAAKTSRRPFQRLVVMILYIFIAFALIWVFAAYQMLVHSDNGKVRMPAIKTVSSLIKRPAVEPKLQIDPEPVTAEPVDCIWPPVAPDGSFPCGYDLMPYSSMQVPKFWTPPDEDFASWRSYMDGEETIFVMIASYRDFQCRETITSAFARATHPERLFIGAVDQLTEGDIGCLDLAVPCEADPSQWMCVHRDQIAVIRLNATESTGPVTARHIGDRMYRGQHYAMQLDAHCLFVRNWDSLLIDQWKSTGNEMAVLRYPTPPCFMTSAL